MPKDATLRPKKAKKRKRVAGSSLPAIQGPAAPYGLPAPNQQYIDQTLAPFRAVNTSGAMATQPAVPWPMVANAANAQAADNQLLRDPLGVPQRPQMSLPEIQQMELDYFGRLRPPSEGVDTQNYSGRHGFMPSSAGVNAQGVPSRDPLYSLAMWKAMDAANPPPPPPPFDLAEAERRAVETTGMTLGSVKTAAMFGGTYRPPRPFDETSEMERILNLTSGGRATLRREGIQTSAQAGAASLATQEAARQRELQSRRSMGLPAPEPLPGSRQARWSAAEAKKQEKREEGRRIRSFTRQGIPVEQAKLLMKTMDARDAGATLTPKQQLMLYGTETATWLADRDLVERKQVEQEATGAALRAAGIAATGLERDRFGEEQLAGLSVRDRGEVADKLARETFDFEKDNAPLRWQLDALMAGIDSRALKRLPGPVSQPTGTPLPGPQPTGGETGASLPAPQLTSVDDVNYAITQAEGPGGILEILGIPSSGGTPSEREIAEAVETILYNQGEISPDEFAELREYLIARKAKDKEFNKSTWLKVAEPTIDILLEKGVVELDPFPSLPELPNAQRMWRNITNPPQGRPDGWMYYGGRRRVK